MGRSVAANEGTSAGPRRLFGIDFSGAAQAGKKIWITRALIEGDALRVETCHQATDLPNSGLDQNQCMAALRDFIGGRQDGIFGLDFPFGLPQAMVKESAWKDFVVSFPDLYDGPGAFREVCRTAAYGSELKRVTDRESRTPFSPYNIRLYRQTYYGIRDLLAPLVRDGAACVLPMQAPLPGRAWLVEICPASTLKREGLKGPYKGRSRAHYDARARILAELERRGPIIVPDSLRLAILENHEGDALDSVVAAWAVFRAVRSPGGLGMPSGAAYALEGYVYV